MINIPKPYVAVLYNWNKERLSVDISYFHISKKIYSFVAHTRLFFIYEKKLLRVYKYFKIGSRTTVYLRPREATEHLKEADFLLVPELDVPWNNNELFEYCTTFKISRPRVAKLCSKCLLNRNKWTLIDTFVLKYKGKYVCKMCSRQELVNEIQKTNVKVSTGITKFYEQQALRDGNLDNILQNISFGSSEDPIANPDLTLFDVIPATKPEKTSKIKDLTELPESFRELLIKERISYLLPIQQRTVDAGLLKDENLLIVAGTSSGKTLIGELAGVSKAFTKRKMLYLSPLVALTNQKYEQFRKRYRKIGLRTVVRVGMSRIESEDEVSPIIDGDYSEADIIVATYEAFDFLLRDGKHRNVGDIGTIVIDEIQMLVSKDRGYRLNGLLARLKAIYPRAQYIYLSATIGNPEELAKNLRAKCVKYLERPIPLERHIVMTESESERFDYLEDLCRNEESVRSSTGYKGQVLIFTNSRRNCETIANKLVAAGVNASYYHAGLTFKRRKMVEKGFEKGTFSTIVTTIALGAGVDFPASLVIFENLAMGIEWLTVAEFHQMLGRAGRFGFHDKGKVYLLVQAGRKIFTGQSSTEDQIAFELLTKPVEDVIPELDTIQEQEEVLATISAFHRVNISKNRTIFTSLLGKTDKVSTIVKDLIKMRMVELNMSDLLTTNLGKAISLSFLSPAYALRLIQEIERKLEKGLTDDFALELAIKMNPFKNALLSPRLQAEMERTLRTTLSPNIFSGTVLDLYAGNGWGQNKPSVYVIDTFGRWANSFLKCKCLEHPFCDCGQINFSKYLAKLRFEGYSPLKVSSMIRKELNILLYPGDVYSWLDSLVHHLEAVQRITAVLKQRELFEQAEYGIRAIEGSTTKRRKRKVKTLLEKQDNSKQNEQKTKSNSIDNSIKQRPQKLQTEESKNNKNKKKEQIKSKKETINKPTPSQKNKQVIHDNTKPSKTKGKTEMLNRGEIQKISNKKLPSSNSTTSTNKVEGSHLNQKTNEEKSTVPKSSLLDIVNEYREKRRKDYT